MTANIIRFNTWADSGKDLIAAIFFLKDVLTVRADIDSIEYKIVDITPVSPDPVQAGSVPIESMMVAGVPWRRVREGYSFLWSLPGNLIPTPQHKYRIIITFTTIAALGSKTFILVWEANTKDPEAP